MKRGASLGLSTRLLESILSQSLTAQDQIKLVIAVAQRRDRDAFIVLFDYFAPRLNSYLQRLGSPSSLAEDITQDVMQSLWLKAELFDPAKSSLGTWIYRVARNRRIDSLRRERLDYFDPQDLTQNAAMDRPSDEPNPETLLDGWQREVMVRHALEALPQDQVDLIKLAFFEDLSHSEIAARTGLPLGTVKSRIRLAFTRLRRQLESTGLTDAGF